MLKLRKRTAVGLLFTISALSGVMLFQNCAKAQFGTNSPSQEVTPFQCREPGAPELQPKLKYSWHLDSNPAVAGSRYNQVMAAPVVGDLDGDGIPEIIFVSFDGSTKDSNGNLVGYYKQGALRILSGLNGTLKGSIMDSTLAPIGYTTPLLVDLQGNGTRQLVYSTGTDIVALNSDLSKRWSMPLPAVIGGDGCMGGFAGADLDGNGKAEIIADKYVIEETSSLQPLLRFTMAKGASCTTYAASLDPSKPTSLQVIGGDGVYDAHGTKLFSYEVIGTDDFSEGFLASGDIDKTRPGVEIAISKNGKTALFDGLTGKRIWQTAVASDLSCSSTSYGHGGPPNIGDFKGNGNLEIGVATGKYYSVYDGTGKLMWDYASRDCSSAITGATLFDFNGDGKPEVIYGDELFLRIFDASTGRVISQIPNPSGTLMEYPVVADVDGDGHSELVVVTNDFFNNNVNWFASVSPADEAAIRAVPPGVRVFRASSDAAWMPTRKLWNQYSYFVSNVTDQLKATPSTPISFEAGADLFRQNTLHAQKAICPVTN